MPNVTGDNLTFNIDSVANNQILVYNAATGVFVAQDSLSTDANAAIVGAGNVGASGVGVFSAKDGTQLKFKKILGSGATSVTESANVITISSTVLLLLVFFLVLLFSFLFLLFLNITNTPQS